MSQPKNFMTQQGIPKGKLSLLTVTHFFLDNYSAFLAPVLPLVKTKLDLSLAQTGFLATVMVLSSSLFQVPFGYLSDRMTRKYFIILGPILAACFISTIGLVPNYHLLVLVLFLGGLGIAAFHPQATSEVGKISGGRKGLGLSIFIFGGMAGYALGPLIIISIVTYLGFEGSYWAAAPILVVLLPYLFVSFKDTKAPSRVKVGLRISFMPQIRSLALLFLITVFRDFTKLGFFTFISLYYAERGFPLSKTGFAMFFFTFSAALGGILGGWLSDRIRRKIVILTSLLLSTPLFFLFLHYQGWISMVFIGLAGVMLLSSNSVTIAMAQELVPDNPGMASSVVMGFSWGIAGSALTLVGHVADQIGVEMTLTGLSLVPLIAAFCTLVLPERRKISEPERVNVEKSPPVGVSL